MVLGQALTHGAMGSSTHPKGYRPTMVLGQFFLQPQPNQYIRKDTDLLWY